MYTRARYYFDVNSKCNYITFDPVFSGQVKYHLVVSSWVRVDEGLDTVAVLQTNPQRSPRGEQTL